MSIEAKQKRPSRTSEDKALAVILLSRDLSVRAFASMAGIKYKTLGPSLSQGVPQIRFRHRIEAALGWLPIWSTLHAVELRRQCFLKYDFDPCLLEAPELRAKISKFGIRADINARSRREEVVEAILQHVAANPIRHSAP